MFFKDVSQPVKWRRTGKIIRRQGRPVCSPQKVFNFMSLTIVSSLGPAAFAFRKATPMPCVIKHTKIFCVREFASQAKWGITFLEAMGIGRKTVLSLRMLV